MRNGICRPLCRQNGRVPRDTPNSRDFVKLTGGEGEIRTPDRLAPMPHFECGAFNHSATSPQGRAAGAARVVGAANSMGPHTRQAPANKNTASAGRNQTAAKAWPSAGPASGKNPSDKSCLCRRIALTRPTPSGRETRLARVSRAFLLRARKGVSGSTTAKKPSGAGFRCQVGLNTRKKRCSQ